MILSRHQHHEPPPPAEGIWPCRRCRRDRVFITSVAFEGRNAPDAPLFCEECGWEFTAPTETIIDPHGPAQVTVLHMSAEERARGRERLRLRMLQELGPSAEPPQHDEIKPVDQIDLALQIAQLTRKGRAA